jgi:hypothetical protein
MTADAARAGAGRRNKYGNRRTTVDGITFASKREAERYCTLRVRQRLGEIHGLELQPRFPLVVNGRAVAVYVADFVYTVTATATPVVEDAKGVKTAVYALKKALMLACYGISVVEV